MGTMVSITVEGPDRAALTRATQAAYAEMSRLSDMMNHYRPQSVVSAVNEAAGIRPVTVPPELLEVLEMASAVSRRTDGAFDITVGGLRGWRFRADDPQMPSADAVARQKALIDYRDLVLDPAERTAYLRRPGQRIDLGGIAKLYILRAGMSVLAAQGIGRALINGGGDVVVRGGTRSKPWRVGIRDPERPAGLLGVIAVTDGYVVSSGDYERYFIKEGKRYHHIIDPRTGYPSEGPRHVTLVSERMEDVNGIATAIMVLGAPAGRQMIADTPGLDGIIVDRDGTRWMSAGLGTRLAPAPIRQSDK